MEKGPWKETTFPPSLHDHSLLFDDDGRVYMLYGAGDLRFAELKPDLTGIQPDGFNEVVIRNASAVGEPLDGCKGFRHDDLCRNGCEWRQNGDMIFRSGGPDER